MASIDDVVQAISASVSGIGDVRSRVTQAGKDSGEVASAFAGLGVEGPMSAMAQAQTALTEVDQHLAAAIEAAQRANGHARAAKGEGVGAGLTTSTGESTAAPAVTAVPPMFRRPAQFGNSDTNDYKKTFFGKHPDLEGQVWVHHAVEQQAQRRYPGAVSDAEMHSYENLRGIPKGDINRRVHLSAVRKSWNRFYKRNPNPTQQQLLDHATKLDTMYGAQFNPPVR